MSANMPTTEPKYCKDCVWCWPKREGFFRPTDDFRLAKCANWRVQFEREEVLVAGMGNRDALMYCNTARASFGHCGHGGTFWEKRP